MIGYVIESIDPITGLVMLVSVVVIVSFWLRLLFKDRGGHGRIRYV